RPDQGLPGLGLRRQDRGRAGRRDRGRLGSLSTMAGTVDPADPTPAAAGGAALLARSNRLGSDPRNTNYAGGNASAKGTDTDPVTGRPAELLWVKGSGGDLGTLTAAGPAGLALARLRGLADA